ncbi:hypothetical protein ACCO45_000130 [Purpureocillium lilacinum]|uniref:Uncharacterized protein n=1 Tax=Purpureocillium lilacinum TaxID=33203 RepID=A0ACC4E3S8_PURLI
MVSLVALASSSPCHRRRQGSRPSDDNDGKNPPGSNSQHQIQSIVAHRLPISRVRLLLACPVCAPATPDPVDPPFAPHRASPCAVPACLPAAARACTSLAATPAARRPRSRPGVVSTTWTAVTTRPTSGERQAEAGTVDNREYRRTGAASALMSTAASGPGSGGPAAARGHGQKRSVLAAFEAPTPPRAPPPPPLFFPLHPRHAAPSAPWRSPAPLLVVVLLVVVIVAHSQVSRHGLPGFTPRARVTEKYRIVGFISSGTYGRVYKAVSRTTPSTRATPTSSSQQANGNGSSAATTGSGGGGFVGAEVAIKKFKPDKEGEQISYTGISQSAIREMSLCSELRHNNVIGLVEIILEDKCIFMVFDYAEHDLLQIIHHHTQQPRYPIPPGYRQEHHVPAAQRLPVPAHLVGPAPRPQARQHHGHLGRRGQDRRPGARSPLRQAPPLALQRRQGRRHHLVPRPRAHPRQLPLHARHRHVGRRLHLRRAPLAPAHLQGRGGQDGQQKTVPFQRNQMQKIVDIMGLPSRDKWPLLPTMPEYNQLGTLQSPTAHHHPHHSGHHHQHHHHAPGRGYSSSTSSPSGPGGGGGSGNSSSHLEKWYYNTISNATNPPSSATSSSSSNNNNNAPLTSLGPEGYRLLAGLLEYDPSKRLTAAQALQSPLFSTGDRVTNNAFEGLKVEYPHRRVSQDDNDIRTSSLPGTKRSGLPDDSLLRPSKRVKE